MDDDRVRSATFMRCNGDVGAGHTGPAQVLSHASGEVVEVVSF